MSNIAKILFGALAATAISGATAADYSTGVFLLNEGKGVGSICHLSTDGKWTDRVYSTTNEGNTLGVTGTYAQIYGDYIYMTAKTASKEGQALLIKANAKTMQLVASTKQLGFANAQGRAFLAIDNEKGYAGSSKGVAVVKLEDLSVVSTIEGIVNESGKQAECGNMFRVDDRVFLATKSKFIYIIDPATDKIDSTIDVAELTANEKAKVGSLTVANDGAVWVSVAADANGGTLPYLVKIAPKADNAAELETAVINIPEGIYAPANSWFAWTPDAFCASPVAPALYWNGGASSWASNQLIFKYDIEKGEFSKFYEFPADEYLYGAAMRVNPADGNIYFGFNCGGPYTSNSTLAVMNDKAEVLNRYPMTEEFWFPTLPVFTDSEDPDYGDLASPIEIDGDVAETVISLKGFATDKDSHDALIVKSLAENRTPELAELEIKHGQLTVRPTAGANGSAAAEVKVNSNGRERVLSLHLNISSKSGIEDVTANEAAVNAYRDQAGALRLLGNGSAQVYTLSGALVADVEVAGEATVEVPASPVIVRFGGKAFKL